MDESTGDSWDVPYLYWWKIYRWICVKRCGITQHDGCPAHNAIVAWNALNQQFPNRWKGRGSPVQRFPAWSPDLTLLDFFLWGHVKNVVYQQVPTTVGNMKEHPYLEFICRNQVLVYYIWLYILLFLLFVTGDHCFCFSGDRFQLDTAIFKSNGSDIYAYILCTWWSGVVTTKTGFKLPKRNIFLYLRL